jgi:hypothetical protein
MPERPYEIHPVWRGIGCLIMIIGPFVAFAAAHILVELNMANKWLVVPRSMRNTVTIPESLGLPIDPIEHFYADLLVAGLLLLLGFAVIMVIYAIMYSVMGPKRSPLDAPPIRHSPGKRRRR